MAKRKTNKPSAATTRLKKKVAKAAGTKPAKNVKRKKK